MEVSNRYAQDSLEVATACGGALSTISHSVAQITEWNMNISAATEEQAQAAREVDRNLVGFVIFLPKMLRPQIRVLLPRTNCLSSRSTLIELYNCSIYEWGKSK
jgi:hypothetical protein